MALLYEQQPGESAKNFAAFVAYREMAAERSTAKVGLRLGKSKKLMDRWSSRWSWVKRAAAWDKHIEDLKEAARKSEIDKIMSEGFAQAHIRVKHLNELALRQWQDMQNPDYVWLQDVKQIGSGPLADRVDLIRYNAGLDEQFRGTLDDLAKETGGRQKKDAGVKVAIKNYIGIEELLNQADDDDEPGEDPVNDE